MKKNITIVGGGAAALFLACELDPNKFNVSIYEKNGALGRKFLVAGEGGLNFTHSEDPKQFINRYTPSEFLKTVFLNNSNTEFISWMNGLGIETYVGTSHRVFPKKGIKPIKVLDQILKRLEYNKVKIYYKHTWQGFAENGGLRFSNAGKDLELQADISVFCLGGGSWSVTGSDGSWADHFIEKKIKVNSFQSSNCAFKIGWDKDFISKFEGKSLKNISITCANKNHFGEVVLTKFGIEGSGIYPLSPEIRHSIGISGKAQISIDLKPTFSIGKIVEKLNETSSKKNLTTRLKENLNLNETQIGILKNTLTKEEFLDKEILTHTIKSLKLTIVALGPQEEAISTAGGIFLEEIDENFELKSMKNNFVIGEMLDYDAPTGGYLLQSCFSMAKYLATHLNTVTSV